MYVVSALLLLLGHFLSHQYVQTEKLLDTKQSILEDATVVQRVGLFLGAQGAITAAVGYLLGLQRSTSIWLLIYVVPALARLANFPVDQLHRIHNFSFTCAMLLVALFIFHHLPLVMDMAKAAVRQMTVAVQLYGWIPFLVAMWFKILLPVQFLIFWLVLFLLQLYRYLSVENHPIFAEGWVVVLLATIGECCVTPFSLVGVCVSVSYVSYVILACTKFFLQGHDAFLMDTVVHQGWTEGFTMFLLALQTGIIELKAAQRAFLMSIVLFIVLSSLVQSMFEVTEPVLMSLGASHNRNYFKHARIVALCSFLWIFPIYMTFTICQFFELDFWLLVVVSSCVLTSVQVLGALVVYSLFLYDGLREDPWESLDDVVYYAKATTRVLEFVVAVFVVAYGVRESLFGEWSWVNTSILIIHCYFNVWQRLQAGWRSYLLRREAVHRIQALPEATRAQLAALNDLCAICYQEMQTARVTPCRHFFHTLCLRKWLYVQDNCPMCHQKIFTPEEPPAQNANAADGPDNDSQHSDDTTDDDDSEDSGVSEVTETMRRHMSGGGDGAAGASASGRDCVRGDHGNTHATHPTQVSGAQTAAGSEAAYSQSVADRGRYCS